MGKIIEVFDERRPARLTNISNWFDRPKKPVISRSKAPRQSENIDAIGSEKTPQSIVEKE